MRYKDREFARREQCILDTATVLFAEQPWEKVTVAKLAERSGIGKGTVYKHFVCKEEILARLVLDFNQACLPIYADLAQVDPPLLALRRIFRKAFDLLLDSPALAQLIMYCSRKDFQARLRAEYRERFRAVEQAYVELFNRILERAMANGDLPAQSVDSLFIGILAAFEGAIARIASGSVFLALQPISREQYLDSVTDFMLAGVLGMDAVSHLREQDS